GQGAVSQSGETSGANAQLSLAKVAREFVRHAGAGETDPFRTGGIQSRVATSLSVSSSLSSAGFCFSIILLIMMPTSYSRHSGVASMNWLITSGGVTTAAMTNAPTMT